MGDYLPLHANTLVSVKAVTANTTLTSADYGKTIAVASASGSTTLTLPAGVVGAQYHVVRTLATAARDVIITPASGEKINGSVDGSLTNDVDVVGLGITITCIATGEWVSSGAHSDW